MANKIDHPGVYVPPPLFFVAAFIAAIYLQRYFPLSWGFFGSTASNIVGVPVMVVGVLFLLPALYRFAQTKNTLITIRPANALQTTGVYAITRNPMYVSLLLLYLGLSFIIGNWWNILLAPLLILAVQGYIIKREERYLERRFGQAFLDYRSRVRRWI